MAAIQGEPQQLEGWGSFKKKIGLNKVSAVAKKVVKQALAVPKALLIPTKGNIKAGLNSAKIGAAIGAAVATGGAAAGALTAASSLKSSGASGAAAAAPVETQYFDADGNQITQADYDAQMLQASIAPAAAPVIDKKTVQTLKASGQTATAEGPADAPKWPKVVLWSSLGLLGAAGVMKLAGGRRHGPTE